MVKFYVYISPIFSCRVTYIVVYMAGIFHCSVDNQLVSVPIIMSGLRLDVSSISAGFLLLGLIESLL